MAQQEAAIKAQKEASEKKAIEEKQAAE